VMEQVHTSNVHESIAFMRHDSNEATVIERLFLSNSSNRCGRYMTWLSIGRNIQYKAYSKISSVWRHAPSLSVAA